jgi:hypothetical protein
LSGTAFAECQRSTGEVGPLLMMPVPGGAKGEQRQEHGSQQTEMTMTTTAEAEAVAMAVASIDWR